MDLPRIDIVLPVWNRPVETRNALVSLMACTVGARFILVDNGSDRETELMLHEFADWLAEGALLIRTERNEGLVPAVNRGLRRVSAPTAAVVSTSTVVGEGWCDPLLRCLDEQPDVGAVLPPLSGAEHMGRTAAFRETTDLSFAAMALRREALESCGYFDPDLDGDQWCLLEYARRLHAGGWRIVQSSGPVVEHVPPVLFGSESRRRALTDASRDVVLGRWGDDRDFCLLASGTSALETLADRMPMVVAAARQGHRLTLLLPARLHDGLLQRQALPAHTGIAIVRLPRLLPQRTAAATLRGLRSRTANLYAVHLGANDDAAAPGDEAWLSFARFSDLIEQRQREHFRR